MADFFFFTEPTKLNVQIAEQAFGAIDENQFRIGNMFNATTDVKAFAITTGNVLVQPVAGSTSLVNIILKPEEQPDLDLPKVDYIIYKGVVKSSLISTTKVAASSKNDLTRKIWESHAVLLAEIPDALPEPLAVDALGFGYSQTATDEYLALDSDSLDVAFYNSENRLFRVNAGDYIGDLKANSVGIVVILEKIGFTPTFKLARELDSTLSFSLLSPEATNTERFKRKHDKEDVLSFLDSTAFFSAFDGNNIKVTSGDVNFIKKDSESFFQDITSKNHNRNTLYLDIRNEYLDSFNYYENYANEFKWDLVGADQFSEINYYRNQWPCLAISDSEFHVENIDKTIGLALNIGDNEFPRTFLKRGEVFNVDLKKSNNSSLRFLNLELDDDEAHYKITEKIQVPVNDNGQIKANYFQLRYIKRYATPDSSYQGLSLKKESYLDNLFPIFDMKLPYINKGSLDIKMFTDVSYIDKTNINENDFTVDLGITKDEEALSFVALPNVYNEEILNFKDKVPLYSEQAFNGDTFIDHFKKKTSEKAIEEKTFEESSESYKYLTLENSNSIQPTSSEVTALDAIKLEQPLIEYDFDNINILSLTNNEYTQLESLKDLEFTAPFKVYLGIANTRPLLADDESFSSAFYALRGLKENEDGILTAHELVTDIELLASDDLYDWEQPQVDFLTLEKEERFHLTSLSGEYTYAHEPGNSDTTYKHLYEVLGASLKTIVDGFSQEINQLTDVNFKDTISSIIIAKGTLLFQTAKENIKEVGNAMFGKDGTLYLARLQMRKVLKEHPEALNAKLAEFEEYLELIERTTRGLHVSNLPNFSTYSSNIPILITGYDPFRCAFIPPKNSTSYGLDEDFHLTNSSGHLALALDGEEISSGGKTAIIKSTIFPVRFKEFDNGYVENFFQPYIDSSHPDYNKFIVSGNPVKMIITFSYGAGRPLFDIERLASRFRRLGSPDNEGKLSQKSNYLQNINKDNFEFIETTLPLNDLSDTNLILDQSARFDYYDGDIKTQAETKEIEGLGLNPIIPFPNLLNYPPPSGISATRIKAVEGSGGHYLSNEIFYRVAFLRESYNDQLKTGHIHVDFHKGDANEDRLQMISIIKDAIQRVISNL